MSRYCYRKNINGWTRQDSSNARKTYEQRRKCSNLDKLNTFNSFVFYLNQPVGNLRQKLKQKLYLRRKMKG